jgi:hypothetical protein
MEERKSMTVTVKTVYFTEPIEGAVCGLHKDRPAVGWFGFLGHPADVCSECRDKMIAHGGTA